MLEILRQINIKCEDDAKGFKDSEKIGRIDKILKKTKYKRIHDGHLTKIYSQLNIREIAGKSLVLVSSHIDTVYKNFYEMEGRDVVAGTLDNSITNAILIDLLVRNDLPENVTVAFTGNEEKESLGVDETISFLHSAKARAGIVVSLDITNRGYRNHGYTVENYFVKKGMGKAFYRKKQLKNYLVELLEKKKVKTIHHVSADPDDTWQFDEHNLNCFTLCLPSRNIAEHDDWMHDDMGVIVKKSALKEYSQALLKLLRRLDRDFD
jgi:putative aminopeptidase FrvX